MPFKRRYRKKRGGKKRKWRQQKLAVGTVQKIARQIARAEDNKHIQWLIHRELFSHPAWDTSQTAAPREEYKTVLQPNTYTASTLSQIGNLSENALVASATSAGGNTVNNKRTCFYHVKQLQCFLAFENNTQYAVRCRAELCYVPNLNVLTDQGAQHLNSSINSFHGGVNLQFAGMFKKYQRTEGSDQARSPVYQMLASKEFILPPAQSFITPAVPGSVNGNASSGVPGFPNTKRKYITLSKYYKRPKKLIWKSYQQGSLITGAQLCDNGNFILQIITDTTTVVNAAEYNQPIGVKYWGVGGCKYYVKAAKTDVPLLVA